MLVSLLLVLVLVFVFGCFSLFLSLEHAVPAMATSGLCSGGSGGWAVEERGGAARAGIVARFPPYVPGANGDGF